MCEHTSREFFLPWLTPALLPTLVPTFVTPLRQPPLSKGINGPPPPPPFLSLLFFFLPHQNSFVSRTPSIGNEAKLF